MPIERKRNYKNINEYKFLFKFNNIRIYEFVI